MIGADSWLYIILYINLILILDMYTLFHGFTYNTYGYFSSCVVLFRVPKWQGKTQTIRKMSTCIICEIWLSEVPESAKFNFWVFWLLKFSDTSYYNSLSENGINQMWPVWKMKNIRKAIAGSAFYLILNLEHLKVCRITCQD